MNVIRQVENLEEFKDAIEFANKQFDVDFEKLQPKIYRHFEMGKTYVSTIDNQIVGMLSTYEFSFKNLKCLSVGTVCVTEEHRKEGIMSGLFDFLDANIFSQYDLIFLSGNKFRYEKFGFANAIENINYKLLVKEIDNNVNCEEVGKTENDKLYEIFEKYGANISRSKANFFDILQTNKRKTLLVSRGNDNSYVVYDEKNNQLIEICGNMEKTVAAYAVGKFYSVPTIEIRAFSNCHDQKLVDVCQSYSLFTRGNVKIQNFEKFITNCCVALKKNCSTIKFAVENKCYSIKIVNGKIILKSIKHAKKKFTLLQFAYTAFGYGKSNEPIAQIIRSEIFSSVITIEGI